MTPRPEVSRHGPDRHVKVLRHLPEGSQHVAVLTGLAPEAGLVEVVAPLEEGLGLLPDHAYPKGVTGRTHGRGLHSRLDDRLVRRPHLVRASHLAARRQKTTGTRQA